MKNILIMGIGRAGKTTLSNMMKDKWTSYNLLHSDSLKWAIIRAQDKEAYYRKNVDIQREYEHGEFFQRTLLEQYKSLIKNDKKCIQYDTEESWTYRLPKEYLLEHAQDWYQCNEMLKQECPKYHIRYIDTSKNRIEKLEEIMKELEELL